MGDAKRATAYFEADVHKALRLRAAASDRSISDMVNDADRVALAEDATDLDEFSARRGEQSVSFESFVTGLKRRGQILAVPQVLGDEGTGSCRLEGGPAENHREDPAAGR